MLCWSKGNWLVLLALAVGIVSILLFAKQKQFDRAADRSIIRIYCAVSLREPVKEILLQLQADHSVEFQTSYLASGQLVAEIKAANSAGIFFAAEESYIDQFRPENDRETGVYPIVVDQFVACFHHPVLVTNRTNSKATYSDLVFDKITCSLADPETAAISRVARELLGDDWQRVQAQARVMRMNVAQVAADVNSGFVDCGIIWDSMLDDFVELKRIPHDKLDQYLAPVKVALIEQSDSLSGAMQTPLRNIFHELRHSQVVIREFAREGFTATESKPETDSEEDKIPESRKQ